jgi:hypothetical protein
MAKPVRAVGFIEAVAEVPAPVFAGRGTAGLGPAPAVQRVPGAQVLDAEAERLRALRERLTQTYSVAHGVYSDPARPGVPLFAFESKRIVAYDTRDQTIKGMLDLAQAERWNSIRVTGDKDFQRRVWIEATARGMEAFLRSDRLMKAAYQPTPEDFKIVVGLKRERGLGPQIEPAEAARAGAPVAQPAGAARGQEPQRDAARAQGASREALEKAADAAAREAGEATAAATAAERKAPASGAARDAAEQADDAQRASGQAQMDRTAAQPGRIAQPTRDAQQRADSARAAHVRAETDRQARPRRETAAQRDQRYRTALAAMDAHMRTNGVPDALRESTIKVGLGELLRRDAAGNPVQANVIDVTAPSRATRATSAPDRAQERARDATMTR